MLCRWSWRRIFHSIFFLFSNSGHPVKLLSNIIEILFQIRNPFEMECQIDKNEHVRHLLHFAFNQCRKNCSRHLCCVRKWFHYWRNGTEMVFPFLHILADLFSLMRPSCTCWLKKNYARSLGNWLGRWQVHMLLSLVIFTQWVRPRNMTHVCHMHWPRERNYSALPLLSVYSLNTKILVDTKKDSFTIFYHRERKMVSLHEYEAEKRMSESLQAGHTHNLLWNASK